MDSYAVVTRAGILIVDDSQPTRAQLKSLLQRHPEYLVIGEAADGVEAVGLAESLQPDIVLLDIGLPGMHGMEAARHIAVRSPASKIVFVTQDSTAVVAEAALKHYGSGYVVKMDVGRELLNAIRTVLKGAKYVPKRVSECAWVETLNTCQANNAPVEPPLFVHANAALASARVHLAQSHHAQNEQRRLIEQAGKEREGVKKEREGLRRARILDLSISSPGGDS